LEINLEISDIKEVALLTDYKYQNSPAVIVADGGAGSAPRGGVSDFFPDTRSRFLQPDICRCGNEDRRHLLQ